MFPEQHLPSNFSGNNGICRAIKVKLTSLLMFSKYKYNCTKCGIEKAKNYVKYLLSQRRFGAIYVFISIVDHTKHIRG
jgi:hypothetical protein